MRVVIQKVKKARVSVGEKIAGKIGRGMTVLLGIGKDDRKEDAKYLADKVANLRIFEDEKSRMNLSLLDIKGEALVVSQFTLYGDTKRGRRPSFIQAAEPKKAEELYEKFINFLKEYNLKVASGVFGAKMLLDIHNDGPVTFIIDTEKK